MTEGKSNLKGVEAGVMPVPAFNGKSVDLSPVVHNGGLLYKYIDCLGRMPFDLVYTEKD